MKHTEYFTGAWRCPAGERNVSVHIRRQTAYYGAGLNPDAWSESDSGSLYFSRRCFVLWPGGSWIAADCKSTLTHDGWWYMLMLRWLTKTVRAVRSWGLNWTEPPLKGRHLHSPRTLRGAQFALSHFVLRKKMTQQQTSYVTLLRILYTVAGRSGPHDLQLLYTQTHGREMRDNMIGSSKVEAKHKVFSNCKKWHIEESKSKPLSCHKKTLLPDI